MSSKGSGKKLEGFFTGKGFYIVLFLCAAVIGVSAWMMAAGNETMNDTSKTNSVGMTNKRVEQCEVVGAPDEKYGEIVCAFIIPAKGVEDLTEEELRDYCRNQIAFYKTPAHFFVVDHFPQTASGKIQKFKLREWAKELLGLAPAAPAGK